jgi:predicted DCC family thiol-disulfide oxidoreductase YuxK
MFLEYVIIFDGVCTLCSGVVQFIIKRDPHAVFRFAALQSDAGSRLLRQHGLDPAEATSMLLVKDGKAYLKSDAVQQIARVLPWPWKAGCVVLALIPRSVRNWAYDFIARNRYRWFGKKERCTLPSAEIRARFLE